MTSPCCFPRWRAGAVAAAFTLAVNLTRGDPVVSIAAALYWLWVRSGRPRGIRNVAAETEEEN